MNRINTYALIEEVQKRPAIWDGTVSDKTVRQKCWQEVADSFMFPNATEEDKAQTCELVQRKWKNVRDRLCRQVKSGGNQQYIYHEELKFLYDTVTRKSKSPQTILISDDTLDSMDTNKQTAQKRPRSENNFETPAFMNKPSTSSWLMNGSEEESGSTSENLVENKLLEFLERNYSERQEKIKTSQDEDKLFLMSLFPSLKSIPAKNKLKAKIEILSVIDKYIEVYDVSDIVSQPQIVEINSLAS